MSCPLTMEGLVVVEGGVVDGEEGEGSLEEGQKTLGRKE